MSVYRKVNVSKDSEDLEGRIQKNNCRLYYFKVLMQEGKLEFRKKFKKLLDRQIIKCKFMRDL